MRHKMKTFDEALLLQDYRKLDELNRGCVLERIAILLEKQQRERHEQRRGFRTVAGAAGKKGGENGCYGERGKKEKSL